VRLHRQRRPRITDGQWLGVALASQYPNKALKLDNALCQLGDIESLRAFAHDLRLDWKSLMRAALTD
jgi:hypothetical protein